MIKIDQEFKNYIPPLDPEEFEGLEKSIISEGCRDSIVLWNDTIIDGHNRFEICQRHKIKYNTVNREFASKNDALIWIIDNQFARRNLPDFVKAELALKKKPLIAEKARENLKTSTGGAVPRPSVNLPNPAIDTREELAKISGISSKNISKVETILKQADPAIINKARSGAISINAAETISHAEPEEQEQIAAMGEKEILRAAKEIKQKRSAEKKAGKIEEIKSCGNDDLIGDNINIIEGDLFDKIKEIPDASIDLLNTDPPYFVLNEKWDMFRDVNEFFYFTDMWLKAVMPKIKRTGRVYISFCPEYQYNLYEILVKNNFFGFNLGRTLIWYYKNNNKLFCKDQYRICYEPIFYLFGKQADKLNFPEETFGETQQNVWEIATPQSNFKEGKFHPAQKPIELYKRIITTGSKIGDTVLDCFGGSGTSAVVCKTEKRNCIIIEKDPENIKIIKGRISNVLD